MKPINPTLFEPYEQYLLTWRERVTIHVEIALTGSGPKNVWGEQKDLRYHRRNTLVERTKLARHQKAKRLIAERDQARARQ